MAMLGQMEEFNPAKVNFTEYRERLEFYFRR